MDGRNDRRIAQLFHDAIRADVHARVDESLDRLEDSVEYLQEFDEIEAALEAVLADVADVVAEGLVAQLREVHLQPLMHRPTHRHGFHLTSE